MDQTKEYSQWCQKMGCPPSACVENIIQMFSKGLPGLIWEDIFKHTISIQEASNIKKNILLHKLKNRIPDKNIDAAKKLSKLKTESIALDKQIINLEAKYAQQDFVVREKMQKLRDIRNMHSQEKAKKDLFKMKLEQTSTQLRDLMDMNSVCQHLKPPSILKEVDNKIMNDMLLVVGSLSSGGNKKEVYNKVEEVFGNIDVSALYSYLYQSTKDNVDRLAKQDIKQNLDQKSAEEVIDIAIAKLSGKHVSMIAKSHLYNTRASKYQETILEFIRQIEDSRPFDVSDWLELVLEVEKLKAEKKGLQNEVDKIQEMIHTNTYVFSELARLTSDIRDVDVETEGLVSSVRESLILLKSAPTLVTNMKRKVQLELQKIADMRLATQNDNTLSTVVRNDLTTELKIFHDCVDLGALRTITLKGAHRFAKCCFSEASISIAPSHGSYVMLQFPMVQLPIYTLIKCCKSLLNMFAYRIAVPCSQYALNELLAFPVSKSEEIESAVKDLLISVKVVCDKTHDEYHQCNEVQHNWIKQTVQKVMEVNENSVDNMTFQEWVKGYTLLYSMLNINS